MTFGFLVLLLCLRCKQHRDDTGYPHDGLADKDSNPQDGRADKDSYPHEGRADKDSYPHDRLDQYNVKFMVMVSIDKLA